MIKNRSDVNGTDVFDSFNKELFKLYRINKTKEDEIKAKADAAAQE